MKGLIHQQRKKLPLVIKKLKITPTTMGLRKIQRSITAFRPTEGILTLAYRIETLQNFFLHEISVL